MQRRSLYIVVSAITSLLVFPFTDFSPVRSFHLLFLLMLVKLIIERTEETLNNHVPTMRWLRRVAAAPAVFLTFVLLGSVLPAQATPTITVMTPQSGPVGTLVAIMGSGFGASQGSSTVKFNGTPVTWVSWSATLLQVQVPTGATSGNVVVTVSGVASKGQAFTVTPPPVITSLSPTLGPVGATVAITGSNFTAGGTQTPQVVFNPELYASPISSTDTSITVAVPAGATTGDLVVSVGGGNSNAVLFTVTSSDPSISTLSPGGGVVGTAVTITGTSFGSSQGTSTVTFNGTTGIPTNWSATSIKVPVPTGATTGNVLVTVGGVASNPYGFEVGTAAPNITSVSPTSGAVATSVTIAGTGFGSTQGTNTVTFNGVSGMPTSWSATQIKVPVPTGATSGSVVVTASGTVSNSVGFTVPGTGPSITGLSPSSGPVGTSVTIAGTNFDATQGTSTVMFNGTVATATGWSPTSIVASVPTGATSGGVVLTVAGTASSAFNFTVAPSITSLSPTSGAAGTSVTITGSSFGSSQGTSTVTFNGTTATPTSWSAGSITVPVPSTAATGNVVVTVGGVASNGLNFTVAPNITNLSPTSGTVGTSVTITGTGFGSSQGTSTVTFNGTAATPTGWSASSITVPVPSAAATGNVVVTVGGVASNGVNFTVVPNITNLSPTSGAVGTSVTIAGTGFGSSQGTSTVTFNGTVATPTSWGAGSITVPVPSTAATGNVVVTVGGVASNGVNFTVVPNITTLSPTSGAVGTSVTITGTGFGSSQGTSTVTFNGTAATTIASWGATSIVMTVPTGATTGNLVVTVGGVSGTGISFTVQSSAFGFVATRGQMVTSRYAQTATQLTTGQVLIAGGMSTSGVVSSAELYSLANQTFAAANAMNIARWLHTATLLNDGTVLVAGGSDLANEETLDSAEIYNPATGIFTLLSNTLNTARVGHTATLLNNGQVLIVGGYDPDYGLIADAELYDPPSQTFIDLGDTNAPRYEHTATMLQNGQVLIAGGDTDPTPSGAFNTAEIFDLPSQTFILVPVPMTTQREGHAAVLLNNGQVLITGGDNPPTGSLNSAEIYDPPSNTFTAVTATMTVPRISHVMTVLDGGKVLIAGGATDSGGSSTALNAAELYDPASQTFTAVGNMTSVREHQTVSLLNDGTVLEAGGTDGTNIFNTAELYMTSQLTGLASITVSPAAPSIGVGAPQLFTAVGTFSNGSTQALSSVLWSSSSVAIAPISGDATNPGVAATAAQGTTTITASAAGVSGSATLTVTAPTLVSITLSPQGATIPLGATQQFTATGVYTDGSTQNLTGTATWSSSATVVVAINSSGLAAGLFQGTATIQANSGSVSASTTLSIAAPALVSIAVNPATATVALGSSQQFQAIGTYSDGSTQNVTTLLTWSSGSPSVATVTNAGLATGVSQGRVVLTGGFESFLASGTLTVAPPTLVSITVVPNETSLSIGANQQLSATGVYTNGSTQNLTASSTWVSSNSNVIGVSSAGLATAVAAGNATVTATSGSASGTAAFVVTTGTTQANLNTSRYQHNATILNNGQILVAGGVNCPTAGSCTYLSSAELYNPAASTFTYTAGAMATARSAPAVLLNSGEVLIAGGYTCNSSGNCSSLISAEIYNPATGTFTSAETMTVPRSGHTMTILGNGTVLIAGGENCTSATSCSALSSAEIYDPIAGTFTATSNGMSAARFGATAVLLNSGSVLIAGGFDGANLPAAAEIYNPQNNNLFTWTGPNLNVPRFDASSTLLNNGQVLVAGGSTCNLPGCPTNATEIYDPVANTFTLVSGGMNVPRFNHSATLTTNGQVVIAGGFSSCGSSPCTSEASTEFFDPVAGAFTSGQSVATALAGHTGTLVANGNVLLIGGINAGVTLASDEWYQPINLTPSGLLSVTVAPASLSLMAGQSQQMVATGLFNNGSAQTLQSVLWSSSNPSAAVISNSPGSAGIANAQATGTTTLTATAGNVSGSASLDVADLVSLTITPANPSTAVGSGQQLTATGTYIDGSQQNVTASVTWSSSSSSIVLVGTTPGFQGFAIGVASGTATITATLGAVSANTSVTVQSSTTSNGPNIISVSPTVGVAGAQVTISGSGFGATQGTGTVWLGSTYGTVVSWTNTQIVATVASISVSGTAQVQQGGIWSNAVAFNVNTATISNVSPTSGVPGTQVTITGSGFGTAQGSGQVWLGTVNGVVQSWSDGQVVAQVALGSMSGSALILQNGVMSNSVPFAVNSLNITSVSPNSGAPGTSVTITGTGFGSTQGNGTVWLGGANGQVVSWSNTQIVAVVAASALTGVVRVEQNGVLSNAISFTVPSSSGNAVTLVPNMLNLVVGQTQTIQALNASNQPVTGLTWTSSNPKVVSLSTDDPPILTALTAGHVTITAGTGSADVTVSYATLPPGTVIWSNPGDGSGVTSIVPAVPSSTGVADVFAFQADGTVQAITSSGATAWTASLPSGAAAVPDFQGGLVVAAPRSYTGTTPASINKLDGMTGQAYPGYTAATQSDYLSTPVVHTSGTIFTVDTNYSGSVAVPVETVAYTGTVSVIGINPTTGAQLFSVPLTQGTWSSTGNSIPPFECPSSTLPMDSDPSSTAILAPITLGAPIIAGDGYAYVAYQYQNITSVTQVTYMCTSRGRHAETVTTTTATDSHLMVMRVGTDGSATNFDLQDFEMMNTMSLAEGYSSGNYNISVTTGEVPFLFQMITNADQGVAFGWAASTVCPVASNSTCVSTSTSGFGTTVGTSVAYSGSTSAPVLPVLEAQDGSYYGTDGAGDMIRFTRYGNTIWSVSNDSPQIATADGGVIGASGITYDSQGNATGQIISAIQSWTGGESGTAYQYGSVDQVAFTPPIVYATPSFSSFAGMNQSGNGTSALCHDDRDKLIAEYPEYSAGYLPVCFAGEFVPSSNSNPDPDFTFSKLNQDDIAYNDYPDWAILRSSMLNGLENILANYGKSINVTSGYRSPYVQHVIDAANIAAGKYKKPSPHSRHLHGDAVDISTSYSLATWQTLHDIARALVPKACIEPYQQSTLDHIHIDWRPISQCSAAWQK